MPPAPQAEVQRAEARTRLYGARAAGVDQRLALVAGIAGVVVERNLTPGQELRPDQMGPGVPPLFVVSDPSSLWVQIDARETEAGTLRPGAAFELLVPSLPGEKFEGRVIAAADFIDPATRTIKVRGLIANPDRRLKAEMLATARVERTPGAGVVVPARPCCCATPGSRCSCRCARACSSRATSPSAGRDPSEVLVSRGLEAGEQVVSDNTLLLARQYALLGAAAAAATERAGRRAPAASAVTGGGAMKRLIHFALHQPLFVVLGTLLFARGGRDRVQQPVGGGVPGRHRHAGDGDRAVPRPRRRGGRKAGDAADRGGALRPAEFDPRVLAHAVRPVVHRRHLRRQGRRASGARSRCIERLRAVDLPPGVRGRHRAATPRRSARSCATALRGDGYSTTELRTLEDWVVERTLRQVPGVADVVAMGGYIKQYEVQPDLDKLRAAKLTLQNLLDALGRGNSNAGGSYVAQGAQQYAIRGIGLLRTPDDIGRIVVATRGSTPILVRDVAQVTVGAVPRLGTVGQDDRRRRGHRHRRHAQGREPQRGAQGASRRRSSSSTPACCPRACRSCRTTTAPG